MANQQSQGSRSLLRSLLCHRRRQLLWSIDNDCPFSRDDCTLSVLGSVVLLQFVVVFTSDADDPDGSDHSCCETVLTARMTVANIELVIGVDSDCPVVCDLESNQEARDEYGRDSRQAQRWNVRGGPWITT